MRSKADRGHPWGDGRGPLCSLGVEAGGIGGFVAASFPDGIGEGQAGWAEARSNAGPLQWARQERLSGWVGAGWGHLGDASSLAGLPRVLILQSC